MKVARNFPHPEEPRYAGSHAERSPDIQEIKAVSWNIKFSRNIDAVLEALTGVEALRGAGVLMLQEMDAPGVEAIAKSLKCDYVYYPASVQKQTGRDFGNAVLSRWPIVADAKLLLPHVSPRSGEMRIATRALLDIGGREVLVYSVHTETFALRAARRREQFETVVADVRAQGKGAVLAAGDFNTIKDSDVRALQDSFAAADMEMISAGCGPTLKAGFLSFCMDHFFTRGVRLIETGVWRGTRASDHFPVWARLAIS